jgi:hypothetical protein
MFFLNWARHLFLTARIVSILYIHTYVSFNFSCNAWKVKEKFNNETTISYLPGLKGFGEEFCIFGFGATAGGAFLCGSEIIS